MSMKTKSMKQKARISFLLKGFFFNNPIVYGQNMFVLMLLLLNWRLILSTCDGSSARSRRRIRNTFESAV